MTSIHPLPSVPEQHARREVAAAVRAHFAHAGVSASRAAREIGMSQSKMSRRTTAQEPFDVDELEQIAAYLNISIVELITGALPPSSTTKAPARRGGGQLLPEVDSNHQPAGYTPGIKPTHPHGPEEHDEHLAPVTPLRRRA